MNRKTTTRRAVLLALLGACGAPVFSQTAGGAGASAQEQPALSAAGVTRKAQVLARPEPLYTEEARRNEVTGSVRLRLVLNATGEVTNITPLSELPHGLTEKAVEAARKIRFTPAIKDGRPVSQWVTIQYNFNIWYELKDVSHRPKLDFAPRAVMPEEARRRNVRGTVVLLVGLPSAGAPQVVRVVKGLPHGLTESAIEAAKQIKFQPARRGSRPVSVLVEISYKFPQPEDGGDNPQ